MTLPSLTLLKAFWHIITKTVWQNISCPLKLAVWGQEGMGDVERGSDNGDSKDFMTCYYHVYPRTHANTRGMRDHVTHNAATFWFLIFSSNLFFPLINDVMLNSSSCVTRNCLIIAASWDFYCARCHISVTAYCVAWHGVLYRQFAPWLRPVLYVIMSPKFGTEW
jgi:hypothetical protein